jgi:hypothetical protein
MALTALGDIGPGAKEFSAAVREALTDQDPNVRQAATEAVSKIEPEKHDGTSPTQLEHDLSPTNGPGDSTTTNEGDRS